MIKFEKYHGLGNDFIILDERELGDYNIDFIKAISHRNLGVGADGVIILRKLSDEKVEMIFYNQDGSRASMCGNGIRCFAHFIYRNKILSGDVYDIETQAGLLKVQISIEKEFQARVNMGRPIFKLNEIPIDEEIFSRLYKNREEAIDYEVHANDKDYLLSSLFMGTTHTVTYVDKIDEEEIRISGAEIENNKLFPKKTNVNFAKIIDRSNIEMKTWERGAGLTLACGTGACAAVVVGALKKQVLAREVTVHLPIGKLKIEVLEDVYMTGPSVFICEGEYSN